MTVDPGRLARAVHLDVEMLSPGRFTVTGGSAPRTVDDQAASCDCEDYSFVPAQVCKHQLAVQLMVLPDEIRTALRLIVRRPPS